MEPEGGMKVLDLQLENVTYGWNGEKPESRVGIQHVDSLPDQARALAALELFDRLLLDPGPLGCASDIFDRAASLALVRFGVRITRVPAPKEDLYWACSACGASVPDDEYVDHMAEHGLGDDRP